jgi:uncharacterized protein
MSKKTSLITVATHTWTHVLRSGAIMLACAIWLVLNTSYVLAQSPIPPPTSWITDAASALPAQARLEIDSFLETFSRAQGSQIFVLLVKSTAPEEIEQFSIRVVEQWKVGRHKIDDGVLLLVATEDRRVRIEVGYGLEGAIPDAKAKRIIEDFIVPKFRSGDLAGGIQAGVENLALLIKGEELPKASKRGAPEDQAFHPLLLMAGAMLTLILRTLFSLPVALGVSTGLAFLGGLFVSFSFALMLAFAVFIASLALAGRSGSIGGYAGRGGFSGGGFSGGFGGGGGGSFGGGGASGRW